MDGQAPPTPLPTTEPAPAPAPAPHPAQPICREVLDAENGNRSLGQACGLTLDQVHAEALRLLQAAPPPTLSGQP